MKIVVTGKSRINSENAGEVLGRFSSRIKQLRLVNSLEILSIAAIGSVLEDAGISFPVGDSNIGIYVGIDDAVEDIKDEYFENILNDGINGVSPLLFPFTAPNALASMATIAFDVRGESITMPVKNSFRNVIEYVAECILGKYIEMAIAGGIMLKDRTLSIKDGRYTAEIFFLEEMESAKNRGARIYEVL